MFASSALVLTTSRTRSCYVGGGTASLRTDMCRGIIVGLSDNLECAASRVPLAKNCRTIMGVMKHTGYSALSLAPQTTVDRVAEELRRSLFDGELGPGTP